MADEEKKVLVQFRSPNAIMTFEGFRIKAVQGMAFVSPEQWKVMKKSRYAKSDFWEAGTQAFVDPRTQSQVNEAMKYMPILKPIIERQIRDEVEVKVRAALEGKLRLEFESELQAKLTREYLPKLRKEVEEEILMQIQSQADAADAKAKAEAEKAKADAKAKKEAADTK
jgi:hypothetical protein